MLSLQPSSQSHSQQQQGLGHPAASEMDNLLYDILSRCLAIDPNARMAAELQLKELAKKSSGMNIFVTALPE
jgi:hypothetical protein